MERKDDKSFKRDIIVLISFPILFVTTSFLVNIGKEMSLPGFRGKLIPSPFTFKEPFDFLHKKRKVNGYTSAPQILPARFWKGGNFSDSLFVSLGPVVQN